VHNQEAVLLSYNRKHKVQLRGADTMNSNVGTKFIHSDSIGKNVHSYFILNGVDYYTAGV